jgi:peptidoglycan/LPS O-acetylase OafA/YrhL
MTSLDRPLPPLPPRADQSARLEALDGLRGVAALCVGLFHLAPRTSLGGLGLFAHAEVAVDLFFMLSGFVLAHVYRPRFAAGLSAQGYILRRLARLAPLYLLGLSIGAGALLALMGQGDATTTPAGLVKALSFNLVGLPYPNVDAIRSFGAPAAFPGEIFPLNPPAWSLFFEMAASLVFLFVYRWRAGALLKATLAAGAAYLLCAAAAGLSNRLGLFHVGLGWTSSNFPAGFPRVLFGFGLGLWMYESGGGRLARPAAALAARGAPAIYLAAAAALAAPLSAAGIYPVSVIALLAPVLVLAAARCPPSKAGAARLSHALGALSYPFYCLHFPIARFVWAIGEPRGLSGDLCAVLALTVSIAAAWIALTAFDVPLRRRLAARLPVEG